MATCCPPGAIGAASFERSQEAQGRMITLVPHQTTEANDSVKSPRPNIECYQIGPSRPKYVIVVFSDVFGIESGNQKVYCDQLQKGLGDETAVWMPDLFRGNPVMKDYVGGLGFLYHLQVMLSLIPTGIRLKFQMKVSDFQRDLMEIIEPNIKSTGDVSLVGCTGFCFGGWVVGQALGVNNGRSIFSAGIGIHPAWKPIETLMPGGTNPQELAAKTSNKPILFIPAKQDTEFFLDSPIIKQLAQRRAMLPKDLTVVFDDMDHGFVARGDPKDPKIAEAQNKAMDLITDFFKKHFKIATTT